MASKGISVFLDTNVWIYYFMGKEPQCREIMRMLAILDKNDAFIATNDLAAKDVFYLIPVLLKRESENADEQISDSSANAISWGCIEKMARIAYMTNLGPSELAEARLFRKRHSDLEDNLMAASASPYDFFITYDKKLATHLGRKAMSPSELLDMLES